MAVLAVFCLPSSAMAEDFTAQNSDGYLFYYDITGDDEVMLVWVGDYQDYNWGSLTIPSEVQDKDNNTYTVTAIEDATFMELPITSVTLPSSLKSIGESTFSYCSSLRTVTFTGTFDNVDIPGEAFCYCTALTSITLPDGLSGIGEHAFYDCESLKTVSYPTTGESLDGFTTIGTSAFEDCYALESIDMPDCVQTIGERAFFNCSALTSIKIGPNVTSIGKEAFQDCWSVTEVTYQATNCTTGATQSNPMFDLCNNLHTITIADGVETIPDYLFDGEKSNSFAYLTGAITIPYSVTSIGKYAFYDCAAIGSVMIGQGVTNIGDAAFGGCASLAAVYSPIIAPAICGTNVFYNVPETCVLYVPIGSESDYADYSGSNDDYAWNYFASNIVGLWLPITVNAADDDGTVYATYYNGTYSYTMPEGITGTTVTVSDNELQMTWKYGAGTTVPAGTPLLLKGDEEETCLAFLADDETSNAEDEAEENNLYGSDTAEDTYVWVNEEKVTTGYLFYKLTYKNGQNLGFYWGNPDGTAFTCTANKAWLALSSSDDVKLTGFAFGGSGELTGIQSVDNYVSEAVPTDTGVIYTITGQRVNDTSQRGIYIVGGKKVIKK